MSDNNKTAQQIADELMMKAAKGIPLSAQDTGVSVSGAGDKPVVEPTTVETGSSDSDGRVDDVHVPEPAKGDDVAVPGEPDEPVSPDLGLDDWDLDSPASPSSDPTPVAVDYSAIASEVGIQASTKEEFAAQLQNLRKEAEKAAELSKRLEGVPADLIEAIEAAKAGQDYKALFAQDVEFNHKGLSDDALLTEAYAPLFEDERGAVDQEALQDYVLSMSDVDKRLKAREIRMNLDRINSQKKEAKVQEMANERLRRESELKSVLNELKEVKGFKVKPEQLSKIASDIASGEAMKKMLYKADGKTPDMKKYVEAYFIIENFDKIKNFLVTRIGNDVRKEDFRKISNSDVKKPVSPPAPTVEKPLSELDKMIRQLKAQQGIPLEGL